MTTDKNNHGAHSQSIIVMRTVYPSATEVVVFERWRLYKHRGLDKEDRLGVNRPNTGNIISPMWPPVIGNENDTTSGVKRRPFEIIGFENGDIPRLAIDSVGTRPYAMQRPDTLAQWPRRRTLPPPSLIDLVACPIPCILFCTWIGPNGPARGINGYISVSFWAERAKRPIFDRLGNPTREPDALRGCRARALFERLVGRDDIQVVESEVSLAGLVDTIPTDDARVV